MITSPWIHLSGLDNYGDSIGLSCPPPGLPRTVGPSCLSALLPALHRNGRTKAAFILGLSPRRIHSYVRIT